MNDCSQVFLQCNPYRNSNYTWNFFMIRQLMRWLSSKSEILLLQIYFKDMILVNLYIDNNIILTRTLCKWFQIGKTVLIIRFVFHKNVIILIATENFSFLYAYFYYSWSAITLRLFLFENKLSHSGRNCYKMAEKYFEKLNKVWKARKRNWLCLF